MFKKFKPYRFFTVWQKRKKKTKKCICKNIKFTAQVIMKTQLAKKQSLSSHCSLDVTWVRFCLGSLIVINII